MVHYEKDLIIDNPADAFEYLKKYGIIIDATYQDLYTVHNENDPVAKLPYFKEHGMEINFDGGFAENGYAAFYYIYDTSQYDENTGISDAYADAQAITDLYMKVNN